MEHAQGVIESEPEKALELLNSMGSVADMKEYSSMQYIVTFVQAKYIAKLDIRNDTLIYVAQRYFEAKGNHKESALAHFYAACVSIENGEFEKAMGSYLWAANSARKSNNFRLAGKSLNNIGYLYKSHDNPSSATAYFKLALIEYSKIDKTEDLQMQTLYSLGTTCAVLDDYSAALSSFSKGLELANNSDNNRYKAIFTQNIGTVYRELGDYSRSVQYLKNALQFTTSTNDSLRIYLNLAKVYNYSNKPDSAKSYTVQIKNALPSIRDNEMLRSMYGALSEYSKQTGAYGEALRYSNLQKEAQQRITENQNSENLQEVVKDFNLSLLEKEQATNKMRILVILLVCILLILLALFLFYMRMRTIRYRHKQEQEKIKLLLFENELQNNKIQGIMAFQEISQNALMKWNEVDKKVKILSKELGATQMPELYLEIEQVIENIKNSIEDERIKWVQDALTSRSFSDELFSKLKENNLLLLVLCCYGFSKNEIALTLRISYSKVHAMKLDLKHELIGFGYSESEVEKILFY